MSNTNRKSAPAADFPRCPWAAERAHDGFQHVLHAEAAFGADQQCVLRRNREHAFDLFFCEIRWRRAIYFVITGKIVRLCAAREKYCDVCGFHALRCVDDEKRALASGKCARNFVRKIHVAGRINQI